MVKVDKDYVFEGPDGEVRLVDLFEGGPQLYVHHFMWVDASDEGCPSCSASAELSFTDEDRALLAGRGLTLVCVSRAPYASIARYRDQQGWTFPWYSSRDGDFTYDFHATLDPARAPVEYNYKSLDELRADGLDATTTCAATCRAPACSCAAATTCSTPTRPIARGLEHTSVGYPFLDMTPYGRQEAWEDSPAGWPHGGVAAGVPLD